MFKEIGAAMITIGMILSFLAVFEKNSGKTFEEFTFGVIFLYIGYQLLTR